MRAALLLLAMIAALGCPRRGQTFDPAAGPPLPGAGSQAARARFREAKLRFLRADWELAAREFTAIASEFPGDPIAPHASLFAGMAAFRRGAFADAAADLELLSSDVAAEEAVRLRARFFLGLAHVRLGSHAEARSLLKPFVGRVTEGEEATDLHAALAEAAAATGSAEEALGHFDELFARGRPAERAYAIARVRGLVSELLPDTAERAYAAVDKRRLSAAFLGRRLAAAAAAAGDRDRARRLGEETASIRADVGLVDEGQPEVADPSLVGALLPLSGRRRLIGEAALRGLAVAAGTFGETVPAGVALDGMPEPFKVTVRDLGETGRAAEPLAEVAAEGAVAAVALLEREHTRAAAERADALGLPVVLLDGGEPGSSTAAGKMLRIVLSVEARARALARIAHAQGARSFAVLAPDIAYGSRGSQAFEAEVERLGGQVVVSQRYPRTATSFVDPVRRVASKRFDALFVPDTAARLELLAPQLAVANLVVQPAGAPPPARGRGILLLATAEALTPRFLRSSARYATGAVLAPGFFPDELDGRIGPFVRRFRAAYHKDPTYLDAYAFDAALVLRAAVEAGARGREGVAVALAVGEVAGLTGDLAFETTGLRKDTGVLFAVTRDGQVRALR